MRAWGMGRGGACWRGLVVWREVVRVRVLGWVGSPRLVLILLLVSRRVLVLFIPSAKISVACLALPRTPGRATRIVRVLSVPSLLRPWFE